MDAREAIGALNKIIGDLSDAWTPLAEVSSYCDEAQATMSELIGTENSSTQLFVQASQRVDAAKVSYNVLVSDLEQAANHLSQMIDRG